MSVGTGSMAAIALVGMGAGAAEGIYAAHKQASTVKDITNVQAAANNKAMDLQQQASQRAIDYINQSRNAPLQPLQGSSVNYLQQLMGVPHGQAAPSGPSAPMLGGLKPNAPTTPTYQGSGSLGGVQSGAPSPAAAAASTAAAPSSGYGSLMGSPQNGQAGMAPQGAMPALGAQAAPKIGDVKSFPNGKRGRWDGQGWEQV